MDLYQYAEDELVQCFVFGRTMLNSELQLTYTCYSNYQQYSKAKAIHTNLCDKCAVEIRLIEHPAPTFKRVVVNGRSIRSGVVVMMKHFTPGIPDSFADTGVNVDVQGH